MEDKEKVGEEALIGRQLKLSEFILGIFVGIVVSVIIESIFDIVRLNSRQTIGIILISALLLYFLFILYKRIIGFPDFVEYSCSFSKNDNFEWNDFALFFSNHLLDNLKKQGYFLFGIFEGRLEFLLEKIRGYKVNELSRTRLGDARAYIHFYKKEQKFVFLIGVPSFGSSEGIVVALKDTFKDLEKIGAIKTGWQFSPPEYYYMSDLYPFKIKGKKINLKPA